MKRIRYDGGVWPYGTAILNPKMEKVGLKLLELLPRGSGINGEWWVEQVNKCQFVCNNDYHAMDEMGGYCCYNEFNARVTLLTDGSFRLERVTFHKFNRHAHNNGLRDYLFDTINQSISA